MLRELIGCLAAAGMLITLDPAVAAQSVGGLGGTASASRVAATGLAAPVVTSYTVIATYAGSDTETWKGDAHTGNGTGSTEFSFSESEKVTVNLYATKPQEVYFVSPSSPSITANGKYAQTYPAPNARLSCGATYTTLPKPENPFVWVAPPGPTESSSGYGYLVVRVPDATGLFLQASSGQGTPCVSSNGGNSGIIDTGVYPPAVVSEVDKTLAPTCVWTIKVPPFSPIPCNESFDTCPGASSTSTATTGTPCPGSYRDPTTGITYTINLKTALSVVVEQLCPCPACSSPTGQQTVSLPSLLDAATNLVSSRPSKYQRGFATDGALALSVASDPRLVARFDAAGAPAELGVSASAVALDNPATTLRLSATVTGGCPAYHFTWKTLLRPTYVPKLKRNAVPKAVSYVSVNPSSASSVHNSNLDELKIKLTCRVPKSIANRDPENPWIPCNGRIEFEVSVKDKLGRAGSTTVFFFWSPRCLSATYRQAYTRQLHDIAGELYEILEGEVRPRDR